MTNENLYQIDRSPVELPGPDLVGLRLCRGRGEARGVPGVPGRGAGRHARLLQGHDGAERRCQPRDRPPQPNCPEDFKQVGSPKFHYIATFIGPQAGGIPKEKFDEIWRTIGWETV